MRELVAIGRSQKLALALAQAGSLLQPMLDSVLLLADVLSGVRKIGDGAGLRVE